MAGKQFTEGDSIWARMDQRRYLIDESIDAGIASGIVKTEAELILTCEGPIVPGAVSQGAEHIQPCTAVMDKVIVPIPVNGCHDVTSARMLR